LDTKLAHGDHALDARGIPVRIGGEEELVQRALIRLTAPKGSLTGLPGFGSELRKLRSVRPSLLRQVTRSYVQEALAPLRECAVQGVDAVRVGDRLTVAVTLSHRGQLRELEVTVP
jgi:hypothetical protein